MDGAEVCAAAAKLQSDAIANVRMRRGCAMVRREVMVGGSDSGADARRGQADIVTAERTNDNPRRSGGCACIWLGN